MLILDRRTDHYQNQNYSNNYSSHHSISSPPAASSSLPPLGNANQGVSFVKIKIFHRNTDDLIAIRVPPTVSYSALLEKVRERLGNDVTNLRYREEVGSGSGGSSGAVMAGGARLIGINDDAGLERWIRGNARLVLYADSS